MARIRGSIAALLSAVAFILGVLFAAALSRSRRISFGEVQRAKPAPTSQNPAPAEVKGKCRRKFNAYLTAAGSLASLVGLVMMWCGGSPRENFQPPIIAELQAKAAHALADHESTSEPPKIESLPTATSIPKVKREAAQPKASFEEDSKIDALPNEVSVTQALKNEMENREHEVKVAQLRVESEEAIGNPAESLTKGAALIIAEQKSEPRPVKRVRIGDETVEFDLFPGLCGI